jgi:hypothetical protein
MRAVTIRAHCEPVCVVDPHSHADTVRLDEK